MSWYDGFVVAMANPTFLLTSLGASVTTLGGWGAIIVWLISVAIGGLHNNLYAELAAKAAARTPGSSTVAALDRGVHYIGKKVVEEAAESWMAAEHESAQRAAEEISQLFYQAQVLMLALNLTLEDVYRHL